MKFQLLTPDHDYSTAMVHGGVNGGTAWLHNIKDALQFLGHQAEILSITQTPALDTDWVIVESTSMMNCLHLDNYVGRGGKTICLLEHFNYPHKDYLPFNFVQVYSWYMFTAWEGPLLNGITKPVYFWPHAYSNILDDTKSITNKGKIVFAGNTYNLRNEDWFDGIDVTRIYGVLPQDMPAVYRGADVCLNLHGDFQKNIVSNESNRLSDQPGMMVNERFWSILGAGGLLITDWVPQMERWFKRDELIVADTKEEFQSLVNYYKDHKTEGLKKLEKARDRVRAEHTYVHRVKDMLSKLC